jgi:hypothetical protein
MSPTSNAVSSLFLSSNVAAVVAGDRRLGKGERGRGDWLRRQRICHGNNSIKMIVLKLFHKTINISEKRNARFRF